jgi:hypothetical protein
MTERDTARVTSGALPTDTDTEAGREVGGWRKSADAETWGGWAGKSKADWTGVDGSPASVSVTEGRGVREGSGVVAADALTERRGAGEAEGEKLNFWKALLMLAELGERREGAWRAKSSSSASSVSSSLRLSSEWTSSVRVGVSGSTEGGGSDVGEVLKGEDSPEC